MFCFPYDVNCPFGGAALIGGNQTAINGRASLGNGTTLHELGHNYGLDHANQLRVPGRRRLRGLRIRQLLPGRVRR